MGFNLGFKGLMYFNAFSLTHCVCNHIRYGHKNELGCAMAQVVAASLSLWRLQSSPVQSMWE